jgi:hypothetical protein
LRDSLLRVAVIFGVTAALITEILGAMHLLRRGPVAAAWTVVLLAAAWKWRPRWRRVVVGPVEVAVCVGIAAIAGAVATAAWMSPPNSADAMAYHLPRVIYWAQNASVAFFPTPYYNQVMLQPLAEYLMLHSYLLSGGDHFVNLLTCGAWLLGVAGVSALAGALGLGSRGQAYAALVAATLPNGILQASGAKNDCLVTLWIVLVAYFGLKREWRFAGLAFGLALATKGTAYLFAPPVLLAVMWPIRPRAVVWLAAGALLINAPQYWRNMKLAGSPLGCDSAFCKGEFRWRNERFGWKETVSNFVRHTAEQMGDRSAQWNEGVYRTALWVHANLGIDAEDPATTWRWSRYGPPKHSNHEADANNRWHLLLVLVALPFCRRRWVGYAAAIGGGFLLFCFYLKWQPFMQRLELPLFFLAAPVGALLLDRLRPNWLALAPCVFLMAGARLPALANWTRPLRGPTSLFRTARDDNYFRDMVQFRDREQYDEAVQRAAGCDVVTIDIRRNQLEYPVMALLRERNPKVRFQHDGAACATVCIDCDQLRK